MRNLSDLLITVILNAEENLVAASLVAVGLVAKGLVVLLCQRTSLPVL
jgi:hypothetical protein